MIRNFSVQARVCICLSLKICNEEGGIGFGRGGRGLLSDMMNTHPRVCSGLFAIISP